MTNIEKETNILMNGYILNLSEFSHISLHNSKVAAPTNPKYAATLPKPKIEKGSYSIKLEDRAIVGEEMPTTIDLTELTLLFSL